MVFIVGLTGSCFPTILQSFTGFEENYFNSFLAFVENYALEGREYSPYDKYFRSNGLMWHL